MNNAISRTSKRWQKLIWISSISVISCLVAFLFAHYMGQHQSQKRFTQQLKDSGQQFDRQSFKNVQDALLAASKMDSIREVTLGQLPPNNPQTLAVIGTMSQTLEARIVYVMNRDGLVVASTFYNANESLLGKNFGFRPYFQKTMSTGQPALYPALGVVTDTRGLYVSVPVKNDGKIIGVLAAKMGYLQIHNGLNQYATPISLISPDGVVFASNRESWLYKTAFPIRPATIESLRASRQFGGRKLTPLGYNFSEPFLKVDGQEMKVYRQPVLDGKWTLVGLFPPAHFNWAWFFISGSVCWSTLLLGCLAYHSHRLLKSSYKRIHDLTDALPDVFWSQTISANGNISDATISKQIDDFLELEKGTIDNDVQRFTKYIHEEDLPRIRKDFWSVFKKPGNTTEYEFRVIVPSGKIKWGHAQGRSVLLPGGKIQGYGRITDITALKEVEKKLQEKNETLKKYNHELEEMNQKVEMANRAKSEFLANMSHEIRTPMTAILGFADILSETSTDKDQLEAATTIKRNGEHLLNIINDILDISKIEAGKMTVEHIKCSPCQILAELGSLMKMRADAKNVELKFEHEGPIPQTIQSDPTRLKQVLINLVGNAIKFTEIGEVRVTARLLNAESDSPKMEFEIRDTGIGMDQQQVTHLFQPFQQADNSTTRRFGGTGLGLTIGKRLLKILGGDIQVESTPGIGSIFRATIATGPLKDVEMVTDCNSIMEKCINASKDTANSGKKLDCRVLFAEDGPDNQRHLSFVLKKAGAEVEIAENGLLAYEAVMAAEEQGKPFDIILMDMQMPVMDGYEATQKLRDAGYDAPIVALTADTTNSIPQKCMQAGCDGYLTKPVNQIELISLIRKYLYQAEPSALENDNAGKIL